MASPLFLQPNQPFPAVESALDHPNGLLAIGGELSVERLLTAYRHGIFPWFGPGEPILWWSPQPRMVLFPEELKISHSLQKTLRRGGYEVCYNRAFEAVMRACAAPRAGHRGTWISEPMIEAYCALHRQGWAHSIETWQADKLVGGLYGVAIGQVFYGESMFARQRDASKIAFVQGVQRLQRAGFGLIDCQVYTAHLASLGAREISRQAFCQHLARGLAQSPEFDWTSA